MSAPAPTTALLDFDGVVAEVDREAALRAARKFEGCFRMSPDRIIDEHFYGNPENRRLDLGLTTTDEVREAIRPSLWTGSREQWFRWWEEVENAYAVSPEMGRLLDDLAGGCALGMVSDNHIGFRDWLEARPDIADHFDVVVCSAEEGCKKPAREIFEAAVSRLGATFRETVFLDDDESNVRTARRHGLRAIHFRTVEQARRDLLATGALPPRGTP